jgi:hypothetical protein
MIIANDDKRLEWNGAISVQYRDGCAMPWRLPHDSLDLYAPGDGLLAERCSRPSGVRLRFNTDTRVMALVTAPMAEGGQVDLYVDDAMVSTLEFDAGQERVECGDMPAGEKMIELWFSPTVPVALKHIEMDEGSQVSKNSDRRPRWTTYGSSITHCGGAGSPSFIWPGVVARGMGFNLTSLGFGGQCHADPMVARLIRDTPADFVSLKLGINIYGNGSLNQRSFRPAVIGSIATIRDGHPHIPLVVCSPIWSPPREKEKNAGGLSLEDMRCEIEAAVQAFQARGDGLIYYVDGLKLFNEDLPAHLPDDLHPSAEGYRLMGENFMREVFEVKKVKVACL